MAQQLQGKNHFLRKLEYASSFVMPVLSVSLGDTVTARVRMGVRKKGFLVRHELPNLYALASGREFYVVHPEDVLHCRCVLTEQIG